MTTEFLIGNSDATLQGDNGLERLGWKAAVMGRPAALLALCGACVLLVRFKWPISYNDILPYAMPMPCSMYAMYHRLA